MKRVFSIILVLVVVLSLSVSVFAANTGAVNSHYISSSFIDPDTFEVVDFFDEITFCQGDLLVFNPPDFPFTFQGEAGCYPVGFRIFVDGSYVTSVSYEMCGTISIPLNYSGHVSMYVSEYYVMGEIVTDSDSSRLFGEFDVVGTSEDSSNVLDGLSSVFGSAITMTSELAKTIVTHPLLLVFVVLSLVGLGIGIFVRVKK